MSYLPSRTSGVDVPLSALTSAHLDLRLRPALAADQHLQGGGQGCAGNRPNAFCYERFCLRQPRPQRPRRRLAPGLPGLREDLQRKGLLHPRQRRSSRTPAATSWGCRRPAASSPTPPSATASMGTPRSCTTRTPTTPPTSTGTGMWARTVVIDFYACMSGNGCPGSIGGEIIDIGAQRARAQSTLSGCGVVGLAFRGWPLPLRGPALHPRLLTTSPSG